MLSIGTSLLVLADIAEGANVQRSIVLAAIPMLAWTLASKALAGHPSAVDENAERRDRAGDSQQAGSRANESRRGVHIEAGTTQDLNGERIPQCPVGDDTRCTLLQEHQRDMSAGLRQLEVHRTGYVATLSHELRTPLTSIKGFAQLLMRGRKVPASIAEEYARTIADEADRLSRVVNDIVDLTRMETGLLEMHREPIQLGRLIQEIVHELQSTSLSQCLLVSHSDPLPSVRGDLDKLEQAVRELLVDAIGRSWPGAALTLSTRAGKEGVEVRLEYRTTEDQITSLIQALGGLAQGGGDGQATQLGHGRLGLYICRNFLEAHGGKMWVECPEEQLARVAFTVPY